EYGSGRLGWIVRFVADVLNGTPSIVIGIFAWTWLVKPMGHFSALAGSVALAALMIPMIARTTEEMVRLVPHSLREAALALGNAMAPPADAVLQLETVRLTALYGPRAVVKDVSLMFPKHSVSAVIGPSGCGKSTFLRCLNRMHELSEGGWVTGRVLLDGADIY